MLVLSVSLAAGQDDEIRIDGAIRVKLLSIDGKKVRLGIEAPEDIPVDRLSIYLSKEAGRMAIRRAGQLACA
jgi:carbon storage regulator CsrA